MTRDDCAEPALVRNGGWTLLATDHLARATVLANVKHPTGPLHVIVGCLELEPRLRRRSAPQAQATPDLGTDPSLVRPWPVTVARDLGQA